MYGVFVALGIILGVLIMRGPLTPFGGIVSDANSALIQYGNDATLWLLTQLGTLDGSREIVQVLTPVLAVMTPGLIVLALCALARASNGFRHLGVVLIVLLGAGSFFFLEPGQAVAVLVASLVLALFASIATGVILQVPLIVLATVLATQYVVLLLAGTDPTLVKATSDLAGVAGIGDPDLWRLALLALGLLPFAAGAIVLMRTRRTPVTA